MVVLLSLASQSIAAQDKPMKYPDVSTWHLKTFDEAFFGSRRAKGEAAKLYYLQDAAWRSTCKHEGRQKTRLERLWEGKPDQVKAANKEILGDAREPHRETRNGKTVWVIKPYDVNTKVPPMEWQGARPIALPVSP